MQMPTIYDPSQDDTIGSLRGGGRIVKILKENLADKARFVAHLSEVSASDTLLIPLWRPFQKPLLQKRIAARQILMLFDVIPMKYPQHFPVGLKGRWRLFQNIRTMGIYDQIITISDEAKRDIVDFMQVDAAKVHVVYPTTSSVFFKPSTSKITKAELFKKYNLPKGDFCMYVGDTNWNKNLVNLARAVIKLNKPCVFIGKSFDIINELRRKDHDEVQEYFSISPNINHREQREFKEFIKLVLHDETHFIFPGYVPDRDVIHIFRSAVCNVLLSRDEGFGLSYLEAGTQKCPSLLADVDIFHEIAGKAALFADPENPDKIAHELSRIFKNKKLRDDLAAAAYKRAQKYAPSVFHSDMLKILG